MRSLTLLCIAFASSFAAGQAYDDAADAAYDMGWQDGSNGGYGFEPWRYSNGTNQFFVGDSTGGGQHQGINSAGRALMLTNQPYTGSAASRNFATDVLPGSVFSIEALHQDTKNHSVTQVEVYCQNYNGLTLGNYADHVYFAFFGVQTEVFEMPTTGGVRFEVAPLANTHLWVRGTSLLTGESHSVLSDQGAYGPLDFFAVIRDGHGDPDGSYFNHMRVDAVPEPATLVVMGLSLMFRRRRGARDSTPATAPFI